jgi:hypothetical protein
MANEMKEDMTMTKSNIFVFRYTDEYSAVQSSIRDYEIGVEHHLVGCNKNIGKNKTGFILVNNKKGDKLVGYIGPIGEKVKERQPWRDNGGREWRFIHTVKFHSKLIELDLLCEQLGINRKIFTTSIQFGHVRAEYIEPFRNVINYFTEIELY